MSEKICKICGSEIFEEEKKEYIIPESYKKRNSDNKLVYLYPDKKDYIKPRRLQIFNDENGETQNITNIDEEIINNDTNNDINNDIQSADNNSNFAELSVLSSNEKANVYNDKSVNRKLKKNAKAFKPMVFKNLEEILPKEISGEILLGKFKGIFKSFIGFIFLLYGVLSIWYYFFLKSHNNVVINHFNTIFVSLLFGIIILILGIFLFFFGIFQYNNFRLYAKKYNNEFQNDDKYAQYPPFLREIYIKRIKTM